MKQLRSRYLFLLTFLLGFGVGSALFLFHPHKTGVLGVTRAVIPTPTIRPTSTPTPIVVLEVLPTATPKTQPSSNQWIRALRQHFLSGRLQQAEQLIEENMYKSRHWNRQLQQLVAEVEYARCRRAYQRHEWLSALKACQKAAHDSDHAKAEHVLSKLAERGRKLFLEGYVMENSNPQAALRRYREAASCSPGNSPYRKKALNKLKGAQITELD